MEKQKPSDKTLVDIICIKMIFMSAVRHKTNWGSIIKIIGNNEWFCMTFFLWTYCRISYKIDSVSYFPKLLVFLSFFLFDLFSYLLNHGSCLFIAHSILLRRKYTLILWGSNGLKNVDFLWDIIELSNPFTFPGHYNLLVTITTLLSHHPSCVF